MERFSERTQEGRLSSTTVRTYLGSWFWVQAREVGATESLKEGRPSDAGSSVFPVYSCQRGWGLTCFPVNSLRRYSKGGMFRLSTSGRMLDGKGIQALWEGGWKGKGGAYGLLCPAVDHRFNVSFFRDPSNLPPVSLSGDNGARRPVESPSIIPPPK